ncbi:MAG: hypothetical protein IPK61_10675 [Saprospiraceae bacterium]|nr:hypothetical protein [Saprospiraceae bacterium]
MKVTEMKQYCIYIGICASVLALSVLWACKSAKVIDYTKEDYIRIGSGGGFVGRELFTNLYKDGTLINSAQVKAKMKKTDATQMFRISTHLGSLMRREQSRKHYKFIEIKIGDQVKRLVWDGSKQAVEPNLNLFYFQYGTLHSKAFKETK